MSRMRKASRLARTWRLVPGGGDGQPVIDACPWRSRSARASCGERGRQGCHVREVGTAAGWEYACRVR